MIHLSRQVTPPEHNITRLAARHIFSITDNIPVVYCRVHFFKIIKLNKHVNSHFRYQLCLPKEAFDRQAGKPRWEATFGKSLVVLAKAGPFPNVQRKQYCL